MIESNTSERDPRDKLRPQLGLQDAVFLVVASVVGSGIFLTPGEIADRLPHAGLIFAAWLVGGALSLAGALANAELGAMFPHAGGDYVYLRRAFHPVAGFVVGWITFFAIFAGTVATLAVGFADRVGALYGWSLPSVLLLAALTTLACTWLNVAGLKYGAWANNVTGYVKVIALFSFGLVAPFTGRGEVANLFPLVSGATEAASFTAFALAMSPVLFSYLGWNAIVYVASELKEPQRNLPRSLFAGLALCTAIYIVINAVYLYALPLAELRQASDVGAATATVLFGDIGGKLIQGFVLISILGTLNATVLVGARIAYAMALDGLFVPGVERVHETHATPAVALWLQAAVAISIIALLQTYPGALDFTTFAILLATSADVTALYALRMRQPQLARPYRAWGYPVVPALYLAANLAIAASLLVGSPKSALWSLAVSATSVPFYFLFARLKRGRA
ncbi:MAG: amino acid permease [Deltaproteobacteria bacterium]|nr:amino acid permease [Deltaproteobacteria bacterium]